MLSRRLLPPQHSSIPALLLGSDQAFLNGDTRTFKQQIDNFKIFEVNPLRQRINQLLTREQYLISGLSNEPVGLGHKSWRETLGDPIGRPRSFNPNRFAYDWLNVLRDATLQLVPICLLYTSPSPRDGLLSRMPSSA